MLLADAEAVVAVHQHVAPQHQRVAAALGQDAALQRVMLVGRERVDIGLEFGQDDDGFGIHGVSNKRKNG